jgi:hypothetical protein
MSKNYKTYKVTMWRLVLQRFEEEVETLASINNVKRDAWSGVEDDDEKCAKIYSWESQEVKDSGVEVVELPDAPEDEDCEDEDGGKEA